MTREKVPGGKEIMDKLFKLLEEIFDLKLQWTEMLGRQQILLMSRTNSVSRGRYDEINQELRKICDECTKVGILLADKEKELEKFQF